MAAFVLNNAYVKIGEQVLSPQTTSVAINYSAEAVDVTAMGDATKKNIGGTKDWSMSFEMNADEASTGGLFDMVGELVDVEVRADAGAVSVTNPSYQGQALVTELSPLDGSKGEAAKIALTVVAGGDLTKVTTAV